MVGTNCKGQSDVDLSNVCSDTIGDAMNLRHFCTLAGPVGDNISTEYCANIGKSSAGLSGEWEWTGSRNNSCYYNSTNSVQEFGFGCCDFSCGIIGNDAQCKRKAFAEDPFTCCLRDYACDSAKNSCFETDIRSKTCDPKYRDLGGAGCLDYTFSFCSGADDVSGTGDWRKRWTQKGYTITGINGYSRVMDKPCLQMFYRGLNQGTNVTCTADLALGVTPTTKGYQWAQNLFVEIFNKYLDEGGKPAGNESDVGVDPDFNNMMWQICTANPGLCANTLKSYCSSTTTTSIVNNIDKLRWCGCYMPIEQYFKYTSLYQVNPECTPTCNQAGNIPLPSTVGIGRKYCKQTLCIIDDVSISLARSRVGDGGINFSQICSSCGGGVNTSSTTSISNTTTGHTDVSLGSSHGTQTYSETETITNNATGNVYNNISSTCACTLSNLSIQGLNSELGSINISQNCSGTTCYSEVPNPAGGTMAVAVSCDSANMVDAGLERALLIKNLKNTAKNTENLWILLLFFGVIAIVCVIIYFFRPLHGVDEDTIVYKMSKMNSQQTPLTRPNSNANGFSNNQNFRLPQSLPK
jgi:hypothetical protein